MFVQHALHYVLPHVLTKARKQYSFLFLILWLTTFGEGGGYLLFIFRGQRSPFSGHGPSKISERVYDRVKANGTMHITGQCEKKSCGGGGVHRQEALQ
jgi:hypothetical protein